MTSPKLSKSVGRGGANLPIDVAIIQALLNAYFKTPSNYDSANSKCLVKPTVLVRPSLIVDGDYMGCFHVIEREIKAIQVQMGAINPDARIDPNGKTLKYLLSKTPSIDGTAFEVIFGKKCLVQTGILPKLKMDLFENHFKKHFTLKKNHNLKSLLASLKADTAMQDVRWAAYTLATAYHETAFTFTPIDEYGKGSAHAYGKVIEVKDALGVVYKNAYYGRGYVQLTWKDNYEYIGKEIGVPDLVFKPAKANDTDTAYKILSYWMRMKIPNVKGESKTLSKFINGEKKDYKGARKIVNGSDKAFEIAQYAEVIEILLRLTSKGLFE